MVAPALPPALPPALIETWAQQQGETDAEYEAFLLWLDEGDARKVPTEQWRKAATQWGWSERVLAYERSTMPSGTAADDQIEANLRHLVLLESGKLLRNAATTVGPILGAGDLVRLINVLVELRENDNKGKRRSNPDDITDLSNITTDDLRKLYEAEAIVKRARGQ